MGGINHQPTNQVSLVHTVPAAEALTQAVSELMLGNVAIERLIQLSGQTNFGVGRSRLRESSAHFASTIFNLEMVRSYVNRIIDTVANPEYDPFNLSTIDIDTLVNDLISAGLLPNATVVNDAKGVIVSQGYSGVFFMIGDLIDEAIAKGIRLRDLTTEMIDGPEGTQGYFWTNVEANRNTWRQDFMATNTALTNLMTFWATTAAVCTEVHLQGIGAPSLLSNVHMDA